MNKTRKELLLNHSLSPSDFYMMDDKVIIRRTGMDKLEKKYQMSLSVESIIVTPYGDKINATILGKARTLSGAEARAIASASPDNCVQGQNHYPDIAYKRLVHKLLLKCLDLYELDIYSELESKDFKPTDAQKEFNNVVSDVKGLVDKKRDLKP